MNQLQQLHSNETHSHSIPFWVRHYDKVFNLITLGRTKKIHQETVALADLHAGDAVLDIGCGTGKLLLAAEKIIGKNGTAVGLDIEPAMIAQAKRNAAKNQSIVNFEVASIDQIPYRDNTFDVVISSLMYHHLTDAQKIDGLAEVKRVLKPNGRFLIVDLNASRRSFATSLPGHNSLKGEDFVQTEVTQQMQQVGFINIKSDAHPSKQLSYAIGTLS